MSARVRGLLAPTVHSPFRKTRSGMGFSPWTQNIGTPLHASPDFSLEKALKAALEGGHSGETPSHTAEDPAPPAPSAVPPSPSSHVNDPEDPDDPILASSVEAAEEDGPLDRAQVESLFDGFARSTPTSLLIKTVHPHGPPASRTALGGLQEPVPSFSLATHPPCPEAEVLPGKTKRAYHANRRSKEHRRERRSAQQPKDDLLYPKGKSLKASALRQLLSAVALIADANLDHVLARDDKNVSDTAADSTPIQTDLRMDMDELPLTANAYVARLYKQSEQDRRPITRDEARSLPGFQYVAWDGVVSRPVLDAQGNVVTLLNGRPRDDSWEELNRELAMIFRIIATSYRFARARKPNRRGKFETISCGISYGGGQKRVGNFALTPHNRAIWQAVLGLKAIRRVVNFANTSMRVFFPKISAYYHGTLASLCHRDKTLKRNFDDSGYAAISINLGPRAISYVHTDHLNLAYGLCSITAVGDYDPTEGGHLILWDLRLIIEFPPGSTITIPSAILRHSNTQLGRPEERRYAFLQYSAGGLFRWVDCDHQSQKAYLAAGNEMKHSGKEHWEKGVAMFSRWEDLKRQLQSQQPSNIL